MEKDVFISYSSKEVETAQFMKAILEKNKISCWMAPVSIPCGSNYAKEIPNAIKKCKVFLLILSNNAQKSNWIPAEIECAIKNSKTIIPYVIEDCKLLPEFDFMLSRSQRIEAYAQKDEALLKLVSVIKSFITLNGESSANPELGVVDVGNSGKVKNRGKKKHILLPVVGGVFLVTIVAMIVIVLTFLSKAQQGLVQPEMSDEKLEIVSSIIAGPVADNAFAMFDGNLSTSMDCGNEGHEFKIAFNQKSQKPLEYIQIMNGYLRTENAFYQNSRPKKIKVTICNVDDEINEYFWDLRDGYGAKNILKLKESKVTKEIIFEILDDYLGDQFGISYITDIYFLNDEKEQIALQEINDEGSFVNAVYNASSYLNEKFSPQNAFDSFLNTAWAEGENGQGVGECLSVSFESPVNIQAFEYDLGCLTSEEDFFENSRPKRLRLVFYSADGQTETSETFTDDYNGDHFRHYAQSFKNINAIEIYIEEVFEGTKYDNTYITDIIFYDESMEIIG